MIGIYKIRWRERRGYLKEAQGYATWTECQVVGPKGRVVARFDLEHQARAWIAQAELNAVNGRLA